MRSRRAGSLAIGTAGALTVLAVTAGVALAGARQADGSPAVKVPSDSSIGTVDAHFSEPASATVAISGTRSEPVTLLVATRAGNKDRKRDRGDRFVAVSATGSNDVPEAALRAYRNAADRLRTQAPSCRLPWTLLAAIGRVESDHGRYGGSVLGSDGVSRPAIVGIALDGAGPVAAIRDTDRGRLDGDPVWDRAVGQMQFIPGTWASMAADGDGDGISSPNDIDDAALAAGRYLCHGGFSVAEPSGMARAIFSYNHSDYYVALVMAFQRGYETGVFVLPSPPPPPGAGDGLPGARAKSRDSGAGKGSGTSSGKSSGKKARGDEDGRPGHKQPPKPQKPKPQDPKPQDPKPTNPPPTNPPTTNPTPPPTPTPTPEKPKPALVFDTGPLLACGPKLCLGVLELDLGGAEQLARTARHDYDQDGATESNAEEFQGLAGQSVKLGFELAAGRAVVYVVRDLDYRFADGSFA